MAIVFTTVILVFVVALYVKKVLNLLIQLRQEFGFTYIFISHDLSVVRFISDRMMVMNKGRIEESGDADRIYEHPQSAYTQQLINSIPKNIHV